MLSAIGLGRPSPASATAYSSPRAAHRHPRQSSQAAYSVFDAGQIQVFKEAFTLIDEDNDGIISENDLKGVLTSLGQSPTPDLLRSLLSCRPTSHDPSYLQPTQINFALFLTMMSEHLSELDTENDLLEAFACFDEGDKGFISGKELRQWLKEVGDKMSDEEVDRLLNGPFTDRNGTFDYRKFCATLRVTDVEEEVARANQNMK